MQLANLGGDTQNIVIGVLLLAAIIAGNLIRAAQEAGSGRPGSGSVEGRWSGRPTGGAIRQSLESHNPERKVSDAQKEAPDRLPRQPRASSCSPLGLASTGSASTEATREGPYKIFFLPKLIGVNVFTENGKGAKEAAASSATPSPTTGRRRRGGEAGPVHRRRRPAGLRRDHHLRERPERRRPALKRAQQRG